MRKEVSVHNGEEEGSKTHHQPLAGSNAERQHSTVAVAFEDYTNIDLSSARDW